MSEAFGEAVAATGFLSIVMALTFFWIATP